MSHAVKTNGGNETMQSLHKGNWMDEGDKELTKNETSKMGTKSPSKLKVSQNQNFTNF